MTRGGKRQGAGRPKLYDTPTKAVRLPINEIPSIKYYLSNKAPVKLPLYASEHSETLVDLHAFINPDTTFLVRVPGHSIKDAGIHENDTLVVDRNLPLTHGKIVVAVVQGILTLKRLKCEKNTLYLLAESTESSPIEAKKESNIHIWGIVTKIIRAI